MNDFKRRWRGYNIEQVDARIDLEREIANQEIEEEEKRLAILKEERSYLEKKYAQIKERMSLAKERNAIVKSLLDISQILLDNSEEESKKKGDIILKLSKDIAQDFVLKSQAVQKEKQELSQAVEKVRELIDNRQADSQGLVNKFMVLSQEISLKEKELAVWLRNNEEMAKGKSLAKEPELKSIPERSAKQVMLATEETQASLDSQVGQERQDLSVEEKYQLQASEPKVERNNLLRVKNSKLQEMPAENPEIQAKKTIKVPAIKEDNQGLIENNRDREIKANFSNRQEKVTANNQDAALAFEKFEKKRIMIVDDDATILAMLRTLFEREGMEVIEAIDGNMAAMFIETIDPPELVILDIMLPYMDGVELLKKIRSTAKWKTVPVVMLTAKTSEQEIVNLLDAGADEYIKKPFNSGEMMSRIKKLLKDKNVAI